MSDLRLSDIRDIQAMKRRLVAGGISDVSALDKATLLAGCYATLIKAGLSASAPVKVLYVPGRIEVLGKHTDYAGGRSVLATPEKGFVFVIAPRSDSTVRITPVSMGETAEFKIDPDLSPVLGHWSNYPMTVARRVARNFPGKLQGADIAFDSDLPPAAGMSSSSALIVASFLCYNAVNALDQRPEYTSNIRTVEDMAGYLGTCENGQTFGTLVGDKGVGTFGGSEDHTAILTCKPRMINVYSYCPVKFEQAAPIPEGYTFAIASSGVVAEKTGAARDKYNRASLLSSAVVSHWRKATGRQDPHMAAAVASSPDAPQKMREILAKAADPMFTPAELVRRFDHFYSESVQIIPAACRALASGDVQEFGRQVDFSQRDTDALLGNQIPETVCLARAAREAGAVAASAFGAGFGGAVWALVSTRNASEFLKAWSDSYAAVYPQPASSALFFTTLAGPSAFELE